MTLRKELTARLPLVAVAKDLPPGRRRPGWRREFLRGLRDAARELPELSDEQIINVVRQHRRMRGRAEIAVAPKAWNALAHREGSSPRPSSSRAYLDFVLACQVLTTTARDGWPSGEPAGGERRAHDQRVSLSTALTAPPIATIVAFAGALDAESEHLAASSASTAKLVAIGGDISADNGVFIPISEEGCLVTFIHPDVHELTDSLEGQMIEEGTLVLDTCTGEGFFSVAADFVGTVLGSQLGTARMTVHGRLHSFAIIDAGHFVLSHGTGGLAGVHVAGTFQYTLGAGGTYEGRAHDRPSSRQESFCTTSRSTSRRLSSMGSASRRWSAAGPIGPLNGHPYCAPVCLMSKNMAPRWMLEIGAVSIRTETELILKSRRVVPARLLDHGFAFMYPDWRGAAYDLCERAEMSNCRVKAA